MVSMLRMLWLMIASFFAVVRRRWRHGPLRPTWSFRFEVLIATMRRDSDRRENWPVARVRKHLSRLPGPRDALRRVRRHEVTIGARPGLWMSAERRATPAEFAAGDVLLFFHGGSYLYGSIADTHADLMARLALATGVPTVGVDYRLAPEHPFPAALEDAIATYEWLLSLGVPAARIVLSGDSAGGNLAIALLIHLRDQGRELPGGAALMSPWLDFACQRPSMQRNADYDFGTRAMLVAQAAHFAGELEPADPRISLIDAELSGLPPLYIQVGGAELLEDECHEFADRARAAGVRATLDVLVDMPHAGQLLAAYAPEGARAIARAAEFMASIWSATSPAGEVAGSEAHHDAKEPPRAATS